MAIVINASKENLRKLKGRTQAMLFWNNLPQALTPYMGTDNFSFADDNSRIYLCCGSHIELTANVVGIYNLHYGDRGVYGLKVINARQGCVEELYRLWCENKKVENDDNWLNNKAFNDYLQDSGFFSHNYGVLLKNIEKYKT